MRERGSEGESEGGREGGREREGGRDGGREKGREANVHLNNGKDRQQSVFELWGADNTCCLVRHVAEKVQYLKHHLHANIVFPCNVCISCVHGGHAVNVMRQIHGMFSCTYSEKGSRER